MTPAEAHNSTLREAHPAAWACLSALGRQIYYPRGVAAQSSEARGSRINATIGQLTDGRGDAVPLPALADHLAGIPARQTLLYAPQGGMGTLRDAWQARIESSAGPKVSRPLVCAGLTNGLSTVADLFLSPDHDVLLPDPSWGNYRHLFVTRTGATLVPYRMLSSSGVDVQALADAIAARKRPTLLVLNFPSNPSGYQPTPDEVAAIVAAVGASPVPITVLCDDAYLGMVWEEGCYEGSLFNALLDLPADRVLPIKVDGATKELFFFGGRVGFITFGATGRAAAALEEKALAVMRATLSSCPALSQSIVLSALENPALGVQRGNLLALLERRYRALRRALDDTDFQAWPYNAAFFTLIQAPRDPEQMRRDLLADGVGVIAVPEVNALRLSYASVHEDDMVELVDALRRHS